MRKQDIPEYWTWANMMQRCNNPRSSAFDKYGGRGIRVCEQWRDFDAFYADMGPRPTPKHEIDRIDVNGHYEPANCRWATRKQQMNNTRVTTYLTHDGTTRSLHEWAELHRLNPVTLKVRLQRGWPVSLALTTPPQAPGGRVRQRRVKELLPQLGISRTTFYRREKRAKAHPQH